MPIFGSDIPGYTEPRYRDELLRLERIVLRPVMSTERQQALIGGGYVEAKTGPKNSTPKHSADGVEADRCLQCHRQCKTDPLTAR